MYSQPETIVEQYQLNMNQITKGRGAYICDAKEGSFLLLNFRGKEERALFLQSMLGLLKEKGLEVEQIYSTCQGQVLAVDENEERYLLKDMYVGEECSTQRVEDMRAAVELLANFHVLGGQILDSQPEVIRQIEGASSMLALSQKHMQELCKVKNYIRKKQHKNEFEAQFFSSYEHFMEQAKESVTLQEELEGRENGLPLCLCHGAYQQHNVIHGKDGWQMIHLEEMSVSYPMQDLANFLRKMMEKNSWQVELGMELIETYSKIRAITKEEYLQIYVLLLFPEKFWKLANRYYNSHKAWVSGRNIEKLNRLLVQEQQRGTFLEKIFSFVE